MKTFVLLLVVVCYMIAVDGRNLKDLDTKDDGDLELENNNRDHTNQMRHRRRSRQSLYYPHYYYDRRDYDRRDYDRRDYDDRRDSRQQEEILSRILNKLEEITARIRIPPPPPPPPQIIYIPFPYPVQQNSCNSIKPPKNLTFPIRWPEMEDENQNWGLIADDDDYATTGDGSRPIHLKPVNTDEPTEKAPPVEHGSVQAGMTTTTSRPSSSGSPGRCKAAILVCCQYESNDDKQECFAKYGCNKTYSTGITCIPEVIKRVLHEFSETYGPNN